MIMTDAFHTFLVLVFIALVGAVVLAGVLSLSNIWWKYTSHLVLVMQVFGLSIALYPSIVSGQFSLSMQVVALLWVMLITFSLFLIYQERCDRLREREWKDRRRQQQQC